MSANKNPDSVAYQGEFHSRVPRSEPMTTKGHAPGVKVGNDKYPEFNLEAHPPGTAPSENTYQPQPTEEVPGQAFNEATTARTEASDTLPGATSASVHTGLGKPGSGQTSNDLKSGKKERAGLTGVGANMSDPIHEKRADVSHEAHPGAASQPSAEERVPVSAEDVAAERSYRGL